MGLNYFSIPKLQRLHRWSLGMDKSFHGTLYWVCDCLSMLWLKLINVSKGPQIIGNWPNAITQTNPQVGSNNFNTSSTSKTLEFSVRFSASVNIHYSFKKYPELYNMHSSLWHGNWNKSNQYCYLHYRRTGWYGLAFICVHIPMYLSTFHPLT